MPVKSEITRQSGSAASVPQRLFRDGIHWELFPEGGPLLDDVLTGQGEIVKNVPGRVVTRHFSGGRTFYTKRYVHRARWFLPLKYLFKPPRSRLEWQLAPKLAEKGIPIVPHWAHGERWTWRGLQESILITEGPAGFIPLGLSEISPQVEKALGRLFRQLHDLAISHADFQPSNILYSPETGALCLVDLDNIRFLPSLPLEQRMEDLAVLHLRCPLSEPFFVGYGSEFAAHRVEVVSRSARRRSGTIRNHLQLLFGGTNAFSLTTLNGLTWLVRVKSYDDNLKAILESPDEFLATRSRMLKDGTRATVGAGHGFVIKRYNLTKRRNLLFDLFRRSRARSCFRIARHLELLKIHTASPIAMMDQRKYGFRVRSYFVMEEIRDAIYLWEAKEGRTRVIVLLAELIARLHGEGFLHRDLKETNILLDSKGVPQLIDLDGVRFQGRISDRIATTQLARLALGFSRRTPITPKERVRFLECYCRSRGIADWRWWWSEIEKRLPPGTFAK